MRIKELSAGLVAPLRHSEWGVLASAEPDLQRGLDLHTHREPEERVKHAPAEAARLCDKHRPNVGHCQNRTVQEPLNCLDCMPLSS